MCRAGLNTHKTLINRQMQVNSTSESNMVQSSGMDTIPYVSNLIFNLSIERKHELFSVWMSKIRQKDMQTLDLLFKLDDIWKSKYEEHRIKSGFDAAQCLANKLLLSIFYGC